MNRSTVAGLSIAAAALVAGCGSTTTPSARSAPGHATTSQPVATPRSNSTSTTAVGAPNANAPEIVAPGDIPDNQVYVPFVPTTGGYTVKVPEGWARVGSGGVVTFTDNYNSIRLETASRSAAPTVDSAKADEVPRLSSTVNGFRIGAVSTATRPVGPVVVVTYEGGSAPNSVTGKVALLDVERYEFWHAGTELIVTLSGAHGSDNVDPWRTVTTSIAWR